MSHYIIELALWILLAYFIGCVIGWLLHSLFVGEEIAAPREAAPVTPRQPEPVPMQPAVPDVVATEPEADVAAIIEHPIPVAGMPRRMERPKGLEQAREGKPDDLQRISGIGPKNEKILHTLGFFHFDQIAEWTEEQVSWVDDHLKFNGRIGRENWISQARLLADGKEEEFHRLYGTGGKKNEEGKTESGENTRRS